jgi:hypothetical protein
MIKSKYFTVLLPDAVHWKPTDQGAARPTGYISVYLPGTEKEKVLNYDNEKEHLTDISVEKSVLF